MNQTDRGKRRFILVQLPEPFDESKDTQKAAAELCRSLGKPPHIATITRERVRRAAAAMRPDPAAQADLLSGGADGEAPDLGFRAYKLATSNFKPWEGDVEKVAFVAEQLDAFADHMLDGRTADDVFTEILLKAGYDLTVPAEKLTLAGKEVWSVAGGDLLVCLDRELTLEVIEAMVERTPGQIVCLDAGFQNNDQLKVNAVQAIKSRARSEESTIVFKVV